MAPPKNLKSMKYSALCFNMKITSNLKKELLNVGLTDEEIKNKKVIKFTKVYKPKEVEEIIRRNKTDLFNGIRLISPKNSKGLRKTLLPELQSDNYIEANLLREAQILKYSSLSARVITLNSLQTEHQVYAFRLSEDVWTNKKFKKGNPNYKKGKPLIYVGLTGKNINERFEEHTNPNCPTYKKGAKIMKKYGVKDFFKADSRDVLNNEEIKITNLTYGEALQNEKLYGEWLRRQGFGVWWG